MSSGRAHSRGQLTTRLENGCWALSQCHGWWIGPHAGCIVDIMYVGPEGSPVGKWLNGFEPD